MFWKKAILAAAIAAFAAPPAFAGRGDIPSSEARAYRDTDEDGQPVGCSLLFDAVRQAPDGMDSPGVAFSGAFSIMSFRNGSALVVKIGAAPVSNGQIRRRYKPVKSLILLPDRRGSVREMISSFDGEDGFMIFMFSSGPSTQSVIRQVLQTGKAQIAVTSDGADGEYNVTLDLAARRSGTDADNIAEWRACIAELGSDEVIGQTT